MCDEESSAKVVVGVIVDRNDDEDGNNPWREPAAVPLRPLKSKLLLRLLLWLLSAPLQLALSSSTALLLSAPLPPTPVPPPPQPFPSATIPLGRNVTPHGAWAPSLRTNAATWPTNFHYKLTALLPTPPVRPSCADPTEKRAKLFIKSVARNQPTQNVQN